MWKKIKELGNPTNLSWKSSILRMQEYIENYEE